jgi:hypothetical protein
MKRTIYTLSLVILFCVSTSAQSADKIIDRYKKAVGSDAVKKIKSTSVSATLKTSNGQTGRYLEQSSTPDRLRTDFEVGTLKASECYNGKSAWRLDGAGLRTLLGNEAKQVRLNALLTAGKLRDLSKNRIYAQTPVKTTVGATESLAIEFLRENARIKLYFDAKTYLIIKRERETLAGLEEVFYNDYRAVDKVMEPFAIKIKNGTIELDIAVDKIEHNRLTDESAYLYPKLDSERPLPDVEAVMKAVVANQEKIEELREKYTFKQTETEYEYDDKGQVKKSEERVSEITPVGGRFVERLVSKNGKPLSEKEQAEEDKRVQKEVQDLLEEKEKRERKRLGEGRDKVKEEDSYEERSNFTILGILRLSEVTSVRREMFRGHEVMAFDFEPKKGIKPKNRLESIVNKLAGTMWMDEEAKQIVRLEARFVEGFKFAGGLLASVSPSTAVALEQQKVGDEVWLPSMAEANISARVFLLAKFKKNVVTRYSDYKKYSIDDKYELQKPKEGKPDEAQPIKN